MSTRALVGAVQEDGTIKCRQVYSDGYPSHTGVYILEHWNDSDPEARALQIEKYAGLNCSGIFEVANEEEFIKATRFNDYHYLYKDDWYYGHFWYFDGKVINPFTNEVVRMEEPELRTDGKGWRKLRDRFIITPRIVRDYEEILDEET